MKHEKLLYYALILACTIFSRSFFPIPGANPLFAVALFSGVKLNKTRAIIFSLVCIMLSDISLGIIKGYPMFGSWSFFTYSGLALLALVGHCLRKVNPAWFLVISPVLTTLFWAWTNLDPWFFSTMYPHNLAGFGLCYLMAVPFLKTAIWGNLVWLAILFSPRIFKGVVCKPSLL
jgi:hypothetical protein